MRENPSIYSFEYYQRIFELEEKHWWYLGMREIARQLIERYRAQGNGLCILDAGCGTGMMLSWLEKYSRPQSTVGIDISSHAIKFCQGRETALLAQAAVTHLPFQSGTFDLVVCNDVIQHLPKDGGDSRALAEMYRVLKPKGFLLLRSNARLKKNSEVDERDFDFHRYTLAELKYKLAATGFLIEQATYANFLPSLYGTFRGWLNATINSSGYQGLGIQMPPWRWLNRLLYFVLRGEAKYLSRRQRSLPFGHTTICFAKKPGLQWQGGGFGRSEPSARNRGKAWSEA